MTATNETHPTPAQPPAQPAVEAADILALHLTRALDRIAALEAKVAALDAIQQFGLDAFAMPSVSGELPYYVRPKRAPRASALKKDPALAERWARIKFA